LVLRTATWLGPGDSPPPEATGSENPAAKGGIEPPPLPLAAPSEPCETPGSPPLESEPADVKADEGMLTLGDRRYRVRGLARNQSIAELRVNVLVGRGEAFHVDTLDLYSAKQRVTYAKQAAAELGLEEEVVKKDLGKLLSKLEEVQDA